MRKIKVDMPIYTIRNKPMIVDFGSDEKAETILAEMLAYIPSNSEETLKRFKEWQTKLKATDRREVKIKDYLLTVLGSRIETKSPRENIWVRTLSVMIEGAKKEIEIGEDEFQFLKRVIEKNKGPQRMGVSGKVEESELFFPYELGQLLIALEEKPEKKE